LELFLVKVVDLGAPRWKWLRFGIFNAIVWGLAFLLMVIPASAGYIKFSSGATYCFVTTEQNNRWILSFWFIPVGLALLFGVVLFLIAIVRVSILLVMIRKVKALLVLYLRLFIFIFMYLWLFTVIFAYNIQIAVNENDITDGYSSYYACLIYAEPDCSLSDNVSNYNLVMLKGFAISSLGTFIFLIFFFSWDSFKFYYELAKAIATSIANKNLTGFRHVGTMMWSTKNTPSSLAASSLSTIADVLNEDGTQDDDVEMDEEEEEDKAAPPVAAVGTPAGEENEGSDKDPSTSSDSVSDD